MMHAKRNRRRESGQSAFSGGHDRTHATDPRIRASWGCTWNTTSQRAGRQQGDEQDRSSVPLGSSLEVLMLLFTDGGQSDVVGDQQTTRRPSANTNYIVKTHAASAKR